MSLSRERFINKWAQLTESQESHAVDAAWKRYQYVQDQPYTTEPERDDPSTAEFQSSFQDFLESTTVNDATTEYRFITLPANRIPWTATGISLRRGQNVSTFASGRVWRSRDLDLWLRPQFAVWFRVGINGIVFNSTSHSNTFQSNGEGELYIANQFPGQFGEPAGGRLASSLSVYDKADGRFEILVIKYKDGVDPQRVLAKFQSSLSNKSQVIGQELERIRNDDHSKVPDDWTYLWFLGVSTIYSLGYHESEPCMHCKPHQNVGILQKNLESKVSFKPGTRVSWDWNVLSLPSRLREDLTISHDYLSIAFEFENGRDLTYVWSWELPRDYGFWCPLPTWADREYHVVLRSGTDELGQWISEDRDLYADYVKYIEEGVESKERLPMQIVRAWFIAGNRWQRFEGGMRVKKIRISNGSTILQVL